MIENFLNITLFSYLIFIIFIFIITLVVNMMIDGLDGIENTFDEITDKTFYFYRVIQFFILHNILLIAVLSANYLFAK